MEEAILEVVAAEVVAAEVEAVSVLLRRLDAREGHQVSYAPQNLATMSPPNSSLNDI